MWQPYIQYFKHLALKKSLQFQQNNQKFKFIKQASNKALLACGLSFDNLLFLNLYMHQWVYLIAYEVQSEQLAMQVLMQMSTVTPYIYSTNPIM